MRVRGAISVADKSQFHSAEVSGCIIPPGHTEYARIGGTVRVCRDQSGGIISGLLVTRASACQALILPCKQ
jgi:hypothetical protein